MRAKKSNPTFAVGEIFRDGREGHLEEVFRTLG
jgi:hypothetical protein